MSTMSLTQPGVRDRPGRVLGAPHDSAMFEILIFRLVVRTKPACVFNILA